MVKKTEKVSLETPTPATDESAMNAMIAWGKREFRGVNDSIHAAVTFTRPRAFVILRDLREPKDPIRVSGKIKLK